MDSLQALQSCFLSAMRLAGFGCEGLFCEHVARQNCVRSGAGVMQTLTSLPDLRSKASTFSHLYNESGSFYFGRNRRPESRDSE